MMDSLFVDLVAASRQNRGTVFDDLSPDTTEEIRFGLEGAETGSVVIFGESGSGKTQTAKTFLAAVGRGEFPELPRSLRAYSITAATLGMGTQFTGSYETRVKLIAETCGQVPSLLFLDEIHTFRGSGTHQGNANDFFDMLMSALGDGEIRFLGTSNQERFFPAFAGDPALMRRFTTVRKPEPALREVPAYMHSWLKKQSKPDLSEEVLSYAVKLADTFAAAGANPSKTRELIEYAYSMVQVQRGYDIPITKGDLEAAARRKYRADVAFFSPQVRAERMARLITILDEELIGLTDAKLKLINLIRQFVTGVHDRSKPPVRLLLSGIPGTGKTELAQVMARAMGWEFKRIEMTRYRNGRPEAFLAEIAQALRQNAFTVLLFDEVDQASEGVQTAVLGLLDSGQFTVDEMAGKGTQGVVQVRMMAKNAPILATTNAGSDFITRHLSGGFGFAAQGVTDAPASQALRGALAEDGISPALLSRMEVAAVYPPTRAEFLQVVRVHFRKALALKAEELGIQLSIAGEDRVYEVLTDRYYQEGIGNRVAHEILNEHFRNELAALLLESQVEAGSRAELFLDASNSVHFRVFSCAADLALP